MTLTVTNLSGGAHFSVSRDGSLAYLAGLLGEVDKVPLSVDRDGRATPLATAFQSNETGRFEVYLAPFPGGGTKFQVSTNGGFDPLWSRDGRELFYRFDNRLYAVAVEQTQLTTGAPHVLFTGLYQGEGDVTPDGKFLLIKPTEQESAPRTISVVLNWFTELGAIVRR